LINTGPVAKDDSLSLTRQFSSGAYQHFKGTIACHLVPAIPISLLLAFVSNLERKLEYESSRSAAYNFYADLPIREMNELSG
jgi:hypothetical protein